MSNKTESRIINVAVHNLFVSYRMNENDFKMENLMEILTVYQDLLLSLAQNNCYEALTGKSMAILFFLYNKFNEILPPETLEILNLFNENVLMQQVIHFENVNELESHSLEAITQKTFANFLNKIKED